MPKVYQLGIPQRAEFDYLIGMTILSTRLLNAKKLAEQVGSQSRFADKLNMSRQQASHIIGSNPHKGIGHALARRIEQAFDVPIGWLDIDHTTPAVVNSETVAVPMLNLTTVIGHGPAADISTEVVSSVLISKKWLRTNVQASAFEHLSVLTARGDSMAPTFGDGDILLVDRGISTIKVDGVYVIAREDDLFVKRVQRKLDGNMVIKSDNPAYEDLILGPEVRNAVSVLGRVLVVWNIKKL